MNFRGKRKRPTATLDMTPLIDVIFQLLIFFIVTTTFARPTQSQTSTEGSTSEIEIDWAEGSSGTSSEPSERVRLTISEDGLIYKDGQPIAPNDLKRFLLESSKQDSVPSVDLRADKNASHGVFIEVLDLVKGAGIKQVNIIIKKSGSTPSSPPTPP